MSQAIEEEEIPQMDTIGDLDTSRG